MPVVPFPVVLEKGMRQKEEERETVFSQGSDFSSKDRNMF
jgi:hypothetical protein